MLTTVQILALADQAAINETLFAQITDLSVQTTKNQKEYLTLFLGDGTGEIKIKVWADDPSFAGLRDRGRHQCWKVTGNWSVSDYGVELKRATWAETTEEEKALLFAGGNTGQIQSDWDYLQAELRGLSHSGLKAVAARISAVYGERFRRAGGARKNHHARRGGLLAHTVQMIRVGKAISPCYPEADSDILLMATFLHDIGKIFENDYAEGFVQKSSFTAEMLGHISLGMQTLITFWNEVQASQPTLLPKTTQNDMLRCHIIHCILSHHGQAEWGSPVDPKTPEAFILHSLDLLDARLEMLAQAYRIASPVADGMVEASYPLRGSVGLPYKTFFKDFPLAPA